MDLTPLLFVMLSKETTAEALHLLELKVQDLEFDNIALKEELAESG